MSQYSHFVSVPMSAIPTEEYQEFRLLLMRFVKALEAHTGRRCFCAAIHAEATNFDHPADAYTMDVEAIRDSEQFVLIWPQSCASSAIYEAGYATALGMPLVMYVKDRAHLPFMLRCADQQSADNIRIHPYKDLADIAAHMGISL